MLTVGVALFATFSGFLATTFLSARQAVPAAASGRDAQAALKDVERLLADQHRAAREVG